MKRTALLLFALAFATTPASAVPITHEFAGTVTAVDALLPSFSIGDTLTGNYSFDSNAPGTPLPSSSDRTGYDALSLAFSIGTYVGDNGAFIPEIRVTDSTPSSGSGDSYEFLSHIAGPAVDGKNPFDFALFLLDNEGTVFSDSSLLAIPPPLSEFETRLWTADFCPSQGRCQRVSGELLFLARHTIPEPGSLAILAVGLAGFGFARSREIYRTAG